MSEQRTIEQVVHALGERFKSGNNIPVERAFVTRAEWQAVCDELDQMQRDLDEARDEATEYHDFGQENERLRAQIRNGYCTECGGGPGECSFANQEQRKCCPDCQHGPAHETPAAPCGEDDHLYAAVAGSPFGDGVCIKCGAKEPADKTGAGS